MFKTWRACLMMSLEEFGVGWAGSGDVDIGKGTHGQDVHTVTVGGGVGLDIDLTGPVEGQYTKQATIVMCVTNSLFDAILCSGG